MWPIQPACAGLVCTALLVPAASAAPQQRSTAFRHAGVIEGFYGKPWSHQDRLDILRFMGREGLNAYIYAPKDDPYHRERWREPYPQDAYRKLAELVRAAREHGVAFWYAISPGGSIVYSDTGDYRALLAKLEAITALGVRHFGLFLDDVPYTLQYERDRASFRDLAVAHAHLINRLVQDLAERGARLAVTPTIYTDAWGRFADVESLGALVLSEVPFFWTGVDVAAPEITASHAARWGRVTRRRPVVWDNYPVNDFARWRPFLGPVRGRAPTLPQHVEGIFANPMNEAHASMIPLATFAQYAADPEAYDPEAAGAAAVERLYGRRVAEALAPFLEVYGDYPWDRNVFEPLYIPQRVIPVHFIQQALVRLEASLTPLRTLRSEGSERLDPLVRELTGFVEATRARLQEALRDQRYAHRRIGLRTELAYKEELDRYRSSRSVGPVLIDGEITEWENLTWHPLGPRAQAADARAQVGFAHDSGHVYIVVAVRDSTRRPRAGLRVGEGDHVQLVLSVPPADHLTRLTRANLVALIPAPSGAAAAEAVVRSLAFEGFMSKWLADNEALTFSEFHLSTFGEGPALEVAWLADGLRTATRATPDGYVVEIALRRPPGDRLRLSLQVVDVGDGHRRVFSLARRNYPANPATFCTIIVTDTP